MSYKNISKYKEAMGMAERGRKAVSEMRFKDSSKLYFDAIGLLSIARKKADLDQEKEDLLSEINKLHDEYVNGPIKEYNSGKRKDEQAAIQELLDTKLKKSREAKLELEAKMRLKLKQ